jgi:subtilisin family serine protease
MGRHVTSFGCAVALLVLGSAGAALAGESRVIVGFKGDEDSGLLKRHGASVEARLAGGRTVVVKVSDKKVAALRAEAAVAYVEEDVVVSTCAPPPGKGKGGGGGDSSPPPQETPWGVSRVWGTTQPAESGAGVKVAVVDTGIDLKHADLKVAGNVTFVRKTKSGDDDHGHGTHVAGSVAALDNTQGVVGVAPGASLYAVKVLDRNGSGYLSDVVAGIDWCRNNGMHVVNMSLGASSSVSSLKTACDAAEDAGLLLVAAAGNSGPDSTSYPAAYASVVAVGATDSNDGLAWFSNTGSYLEISAPGVSVLSTARGGSYTTMSGTSMASPHVAGLAAVLWAEATDPDGESVRAELVTRVRDAGPTGWDKGFGHGIAYYPGE